MTTFQTTVAGVPRHSHIIAPDECALSSFDEEHDHAVKMDGSMEHAAGHVHKAANIIAANGDLRGGSAATDIFHRQQAAKTKAAARLSQVSP